MSSSGLASRLGGFPVGGGGLGGSGLEQNESKSDAKDSDESKVTATQRIRHIGIKTFYWKNDEWQDSEYGTLKEDAQKDVVEVQQLSDEYFKLTNMNDGRYSKYLTFTEPVLIRVDGRNYRIVPPHEE